MQKCLLCIVVAVTVLVGHVDSAEDTTAMASSTDEKTTGTNSSGPSTESADKKTDSLGKEPGGLGKEKKKPDTGKGGSANDNKSKKDARKDSNGFLNVLNGKSRKEMFRSGKTTDPKLMSYMLALKRQLLGLKCIKKCSMVSEGFEEDMDKVVKILATLPPINNIKVDNSPDNLKEVLAALRTYASPTFFHTASIRSLAKRKDTSDVNIKPMDLVGESLVPKVKVNKAGNDYSDGAPTAEINFATKSPVAGTPEEKLDHFREDHELQGFHWLFHNIQPEFQPVERHRERFAYMHRNLLYRYAIERHLAGLPQLVPFSHEERIKPFNSYYPNKSFKNASPTKATCTLSEASDKTLQDGWARTLEQIDKPEEEFDKYAEILYHNPGHDRLSKECAEEKREGFLTDSEYSARDPIFYRWHTEVERLMNQYKEKHPYSADALKPADVSVASMELKSRCAKPNLVETYIDSRRFPVRFDDTDTMVSEKILNHEEFDLTIKLVNPNKKTGKVIFRLFLGLDEFINEARWLVEMDRWVVALSGAPQETVVRKSADNFLTDKLDINQWNRDQTGQEPCAWPRNLYLPKGKEDGPANLRLVVFVHDTQDNVNEGMDPQKPGMYCGSRDGSVNFDPRPFGFPLDRGWTGGLDKIAVITNKNPTFGNVSLPFVIKFSQVKAPSCADDGPGAPAAPGPVAPPGAPAAPGPVAPPGAPAAPGPIAPVPSADVQGNNTAPAPSATSNDSTASPGAGASNTSQSAGGASSDSSPSPGAAVANTSQPPAGAENATSQPAAGANSDSSPSPGGAATNTSQPPGGAESPASQPAGGAGSDSSTSPPGAASGTSQPPAGADSASSQPAGGASPSGGGTSGSCPPGYYHISNTCYLVPMVPATYDAAVSKCGEKQGRLVDYTEEKKPTVLMIAEAVGGQMTQGEVHFWMGGSSSGPGAQCNFVGKQGLGQADCNAEKGDAEGTNFVMVALCTT